MTPVSHGAAALDRHGLQGDLMIPRVGHDFYKRMFVTEY